jgi:beta-glucanase (GH16 family)
MVETDGKFNFQFGYAEAKIWMPSGPGLWPAFWINGHRNPEDGEIDVVEASGTDAGRYHYHYQCGPKRCSPGGEIPVKGATSGWHVYAAEWKPDVIAWYYDGRKVFERHEAIGSAPHYLVLNLGLRRNGNGYAVPGTMRVDYVRVWQH